MMSWRSRAVVSGVALLALAGCGSSAKSAIKAAPKAGVDTTIAQTAAAPKPTSAPKPKPKPATPTTHVTVAPPTVPPTAPPTVPQTAPPQPTVPAPAAPQITQPAAPACTPGYDPCIPPGPDVDCAGGSGNGPRYVQGPVHVTGPDIYGLDADGNGIGCQ